MKKAIAGTAAALAVAALCALPAFGLDTERMHGSDVQVSAGLGFEVTYGSYGSSADATLVTMPVVVDLYPTHSTDIELNIPLVFLSSKNGSQIMVTSSGGTGRRRGAPAGSGSMSSVVTTVSAATTEAGIGDINLTAGWAVVRETEEWVPKLRPLAYLKLPSGDRDRGLGTGTVEGGPGLAVSKWLGEFQIFAEGAYIFQDRNVVYAGKNYLSYLAGAGMQATDRLFVSLMAKGGTQRADGAAAQSEARLKAVFMQSRKVSWELYGLAGFTKASPDGGGGLLVMYQF